MSPRGVAVDKTAIETMLTAQRDAMAADGKARSFLYTSGVWCLAARPGRPKKMRRRSPAAREWRPGHEDLVLAAASSGLRPVVIRPGIVYGGGRGIVSDLVKDALNGMVRVVGQGKNRWPCVYDHDLGDLYVRILEAPMATGIYHANDEEDERVSDIVEAIAAQVPQKPDIRYMPMAEARKKLGTTPTRWRSIRRSAVRGRAPWAGRRPCLVSRTAWPGWSRNTATRNGSGSPKCLQCQRSPDSRRHSSSHRCLHAAAATASAAA